MMALHWAMVSLVPTSFHTALLGLKELAFKMTFSTLQRYEINNNIISIYFKFATTKNKSNMSYLHELGVMSSVDHHTMHPLSVPQLGSPQQDLVRSQWYGAVVRTINESKFLFTPLQEERKADKVWP